MKIVALSGFGQPHDALVTVAPGATPVDYAAENEVEAALDVIARAADGADLLLGWSMGGQMAVRAVLERGVRLRRLALIAAPFQFARSEALALGLGRDTFAQYRDNLRQNPERAWRKSYALISHWDARSERIQKHLTTPPAHDWVYWLDTMGGYSMVDADMSLLPPTLLIHGEKDAVIDSAQAKAYHSALPASTLHLFPECGHAPHWHDTEQVRRLIAEHLA